MSSYIRWSATWRSVRPSVPSCGKLATPTLVPILTCCLLLGVFPQPVIDSMRPDVQIVANILHKAQQNAATAVAQR